MSCIYSDCNGYCSLSSKESPMQGCSKEEYSEGEDAYLCVVEDDPTPSDNCDSYESDSVCHECGADFNADEECTC